jgi:hypothetical protein
VLCDGIVQTIEHDVTVFDERAWPTLNRWTWIVVGGTGATHDIESGGGEAGEVGDCQRGISGLDDKTEGSTRMVRSSVQHGVIAPHARLRR